tara:strand:+ start:220 stop:384 length:165 start_codon:yes stop_codon:yes gene_type:complete
MNKSKQVKVITRNEANKQWNDWSAKNLGKMGRINVKPLKSLFMMGLRQKGFKIQ